MTKSSDRSEKRPPLLDLASHPEPFVRTEDLAKYWSVSRRQIYKQIENGSLPAIRMGPRSVRIPTREAAEFERRSMFGTPPSTADVPAPAADRAAKEERWRAGGSERKEFAKKHD